MKVRSSELELLDADDIPVKDLYQNLKELEIINQLLGGHQLNRKAFLRSLPDTLPDTLQVIEVASGGGDNLRNLARLCRKKGIKASFIGVDIKPDCIAFAQEASITYPEISFVCSDYREYMPIKPADISFSSLFCHHLNTDQIGEYLAWNRQNACTFFINDLHRHPVAERAIALLTRMFSHSYLVKNDAPASVRRGFKRSDWNQLLVGHRGNISLTWQWAFRWMIIAKNGA